METALVIVEPPSPMEAPSGLVSPIEKPVEETSKDAPKKSYAAIVSCAGSTVPSTTYSTSNVSASLVDRQASYSSRPTFATARQDRP